MGESPDAPEDSSLRILSAYQRDALFGDSPRSFHGMSLSTIRALYDQRSTALRL